MNDIPFSHFWGLNLIGAVGFGIITMAFVILVVVLKGMALWHASRRDDKWWFIVMLVINTAGILELFYLLFIVGKWHKFKDNGVMPAKDNTPDKTTTAENDSGSSQAKS